jgi:hypothetical protein
VDTPGYMEGTSEQDDMNLVVDYMESLLHQTSSVTTLEDSEVIGVVSGSGGILVDVVLYLLPPCKSALNTTTLLLLTISRPGYNKGR